MVLVIEMQTWGPTVGPPDLDNPGFKWLPNIQFEYTIFYPEYFHIWNTKHHCQQEKSAVSMLPCVISSIVALPEKHLKMHMQNEHDES